MFLDEYPMENECFKKQSDMKKCLHVAGFILTFFILVSYTLLGPMDEVVSAMKNGNAALLSKYFDQTVEVSLPDRSDAYSKTQAEVVLRDFFQTKGVRDFRNDHRSDNRGSEFCIGTLITRNGSYRVTLHMKMKSERQLLQEIRIENGR
jgi:hypothetical protein